MLDPPSRAVDHYDPPAIDANKLSPHTHLDVPVGVEETSAKDGVSCQTVFQPVVAEKNDPQLPVAWKESSGSYLNYLYMMHQNMSECN